MPLEYNPIHHGQFLQVMGELGLGPDDVAGILNKEPRRVKEWYSGQRGVPEHQLEPLWELYQTWLKQVRRMFIKMTNHFPNQVGYIVYTNQSDYLEAPHDELTWPTYKVHLNLTARAASMSDHPVKLIPYLQAAYKAWLHQHEDTYNTRQQWANRIANKIHLPKATGMTELMEFTKWGSE